MNTKSEGENIQQLYIYHENKGNYCLLCESKGRLAKYSQGKVDLPYEIVKVTYNVTVCLTKGIVTETIDIRNIKSLVRTDP
jgi:hypothetical protein